VPRRHSIAWRRELEVVVPVNNLDLWRHPGVNHHLTATLDFLTGDTWSFVFKARKHRTVVRPQSHLPFQSKSSRVIPFSSGLDSFAVARLTAAREPEIPLILVTTGTHINPDPSILKLPTEGSSYWVSIPFRLSQRRRVNSFREPSFRSRGFVYGVMAGIAAHLLQADRVVIPESGQGSLGPWLQPVGGEAADVRGHPFFTGRLATLLKLVLGTNVSYQHPQLWRTKGETLSELKELGYSDGWWLTTSCARDARHMAIDKHRVQCGVCASCLLRRQSLFAACLDERRDCYCWTNLCAPNLAQAAASESRPTGRNDEGQAKCAVLALEDLSRATEDSRGIESAVSELSAVSGEDSNNVCAKLCRLLDAHKNEWRAFLSTLGPASFINQWLSTLR